jgi:hypothetical protein
MPDKAPYSDNLSNEIHNNLLRFRLFAQEVREFL